MHRKLIYLSLCFFLSLSGFAQLNIIPKPVEMQIDQSGTYALNNKTAIVASDANTNNATKFFNDYLKEIYDFNLPVKNKGKQGGVQLVIDKSAAPEGGYTLDVNNGGVMIRAADGQGIFYGIQTLIQLLPVEKSKSLAVPYVKIADKPRFQYRGLHLDVGRHFFPVEFVKKYIDYIALHKMNYFHWHLTEDQGWRIEIKKYPELTKVGGYRNGTIIGHHPGTGNDNKRYGGFYTQEEVKEVVKYAADRYITVVPEIEMPGHASAAIAAFSWLSCFPNESTVIPHHPSTLSAQTKGKHVQEQWGVFEDVFCAGKDSTFDFLQNVLDEVIQLFPSKYVHVGGDESPKDNWKRCPRCQQRIKDEHLKDEHHLQSYFIQRMEKYLNGKGRTLIGWDEILEGGLAPNAIVMSWRGEEGGVEAAKQNHQVIMTPGSHVYFDHSQLKPEDSLTIGGYTTVEKVYSYEPVPKELPQDKESFVWGAQANLWTEYIDNTSKVEYQIFPRVSALSEVLWSPKDARDWNNFKSRLPSQEARYKLWNANYCRKALAFE